MIRIKNMMSIPVLTGILIILMMLACLNDAFCQVKGPKAPPNARLEQARNGTMLNPAVEWTTGSISGAQGHFLEGMSVPYRLVMKNLPTTPGSNYISLLLGFDIMQGEKHAIDFLTDYENLEPHAAFGHPVEDINPLEGYEGNFPPGYDVTYLPIPTPDSLSLVIDGDPQPQTAFISLQSGGLTDFNLYGGQLIMAYYTSEGDLNAAQSEARIRITFYATNSTAILAFGGRIADEATWSEGMSARNINGSPYHTRLLGWNIGNTGQQDRSCNSNAVAAIPDCSFTGPASACEGSTLAYTASSTGMSTTFQWSFGGLPPFIQSFVGSTIGSTVDVNTGSPSAPYTFILQLAASEPFQGGTLTGTCQQVVEVNLGPEGQINASGGDEEICANEVGHYEAIIPPPPPGLEVTYDYLWEITGEGMIVDENGNPLDPPFTGPDVYVKGNPVCDGDFTLSVTITDNFSCTGYAIATFVVDDNTPPTLQCPGDITATCEAPDPISSLDEFLAAGGTASDLCGTGPGAGIDPGSFSYLDNIIEEDCPLVIGRTYQMADLCGNTATCSHTITFMDDEAPAITCPADVTINCSASTAPSVTGYAMATDACDADPQITYEDANSVVEGCGAITRTWAATDNCGNTGICIQTITVTDQEPPVLYGVPADITFQCEIPEDFEFPDPSIVTATDNCDPEVTISYSWHSETADCTQEGHVFMKIIQTWAGSDECGNSTIEQYIAYVVDTEPPVIELNDDIYGDCGTQPVIEPAVTDNCDDSPTLSCTWIDANGNVMSCDDPFPAGTWTVTITASDYCGNEAEPVILNINIDSPVSCEIDGPVSGEDQLPFCGMVNNPITAYFYISGQPAPEGTVASMQWTLSGTDWEITSDPNQPSITYIAGTGTGTFVINFTDIYGCEGSCEFSFDCLGTASEECTLTQGAYGNEGGYFCDGSGTLDLINNLLDEQGALVLGLDMPPYGNSFTLSPGEGQCVIDILPGGGQSYALEGFYNCDDKEGLLNDQGRLNNTLLAQMITLGLNLRLSDDLSGLPMITNILVSSATTGCGQYGDGDPVGGTWEYFEVPQEVYDYLFVHYNNPPTVGDLFLLGNDALGGSLGEGSPALDDIAMAVDVINNGFDECRFGTFEGGYIPPDLQNAPAVNPGYTGLPGEPKGEISLTAFPNPFRASATIEFVVPLETFAILEVYSLSGVKLLTLFEGNAVEHELYSFVFPGEDFLSKATYFFVLKTEYSTKFGRLVMVR